MDFLTKLTKERGESMYKVIYIKEKLVEELEVLAAHNETGFNNVVISMIEACMDEKYTINCEKRKRCCLRNGRNLDF